MAEDDSRDKLRANIVKLIAGETKPKKVLKQLRKKFPDAKSRDIALAAFAAMIEIADEDGDKALALQEIALSNRE